MAAIRGITPSMLASRQYLAGLSGTSAQALRTGGWANPSRGGELKFIDTNASTAVTFAVSTFATGVL